MFVCACCGAELTGPLARVELPDHTHQRIGHDMLPVLMEAGTYAVDPEPEGPPWRRWEELGPGEAAARGVFAPEYALSFGAPGSIVIAPGDAHGTVLIPGRYEGSCLGLTGFDGPNLACAECAEPVASRVDDCTYWQTVRLAPYAVRGVPAAGPVRPPLTWEALAREGRRTPPVEPEGWWSPVWRAAVGVALAHLLVAAEGAPVAVPSGLLATTFGRALDTFLPHLPPGRATRTLALAGPGLPAPVGAPDIALVPRHPETGETWPGSGARAVVPLAAEVWLYLAFPEDRSRLPVTGGLPPGVERDDPLPRHPHWLFAPDGEVFRRTLARLPAVREPWLRRIHDGR